MNRKIYRKTEKVLLLLLNFDVTGFEEAEKAVISAFRLLIARWRSVCVFLYSIVLNWKILLKSIIREKKLKPL